MKGCAWKLSAIKDILDVVYGKRNYFLFALTLYCIYIGVFPFPESMIDHPLIDIVLPAQLITDTNMSLFVHVTSFYGFIWFLFFLMAALSTKFDSLFVNSISKVKYNLESTLIPFTLLIEYLFILFKLRGISLVDFIENRGLIEHPLMWSIGLYMPFLFIVAIIRISIFPTRHN